MHTHTHTHTRPRLTQQAALVAAQGVRVPTIAISPWINKGIVEHAPTKSNAPTPSSQVHHVTSVLLGGVSVTLTAPQPVRSMEHHQCLQRSSESLDGRTSSRSEMVSESAGVLPLLMPSSSSRALCVAVRPPHYAAWAAPFDHLWASRTTPPSTPRTWTRRWRSPSSGPLRSAAS